MYYFMRSHRLQWKRKIEPNASIIKNGKTERIEITNPKSGPPSQYNKKTNIIKYVRVYQATVKKERNENEGIKVLIIISTAKTTYWILYMGSREIIVLYTFMKKLLKLCTYICKCRGYVKSSGKILFHTLLRHISCKVQHIYWIKKIVIKKLCSF